MITSKAYASVFDNVGRRAKAAAQYPTKNFTDVVPTELRKELFQYLLLRAGAVDITNLNTKDNPEHFSKHYKEEVRYAAKNLFKVAEDFVSTQPTLKKVVIMTQTPRYDVKAVDSLSLKPNTG